MYIGKLADAGTTDDSKKNYYNKLRKTSKLLLKSIDRALKYTMNYLMCNILDLIKSSRELYSIFNSIGKNPICPHENITNTNNSKKISLSND